MVEFDVRKHLHQQPPPFIESMEEAFRHLAEKASTAKSPDLTGCTSYVSRKMRVGYNLAAAIMEEMEKDGWITPAGSRGERRLIRHSHGQSEGGK